MVAVVGHAKPQYFGVDSRASPACKLVLLQDETTGPLSNHKAISILVEGPGSGERIIVSLGQGSQRAKAANSKGSNRRLGTPANHDIGFRVLDGPHGQSNGMPAR